MLATMSSGYTVLAVLMYEALTLPRKVLISNGEIYEDNSKKLIDKLMDFNKGEKYKKELEDLNLKYKEYGVFDLLKIEEMRKSAELNLKVAKEKTSKLKNDTREQLEEMRKSAESNLKVTKEKQSELKKDAIELELNLKELRIESNKNKEIERLNYELKVIKESTVYWQEIADDESLGIFTRPEELYPSEYYMEELKKNKDNQKELKKFGLATEAKSITVDGSSEKGKKLQENNVKQILRSFDNEADVLIKTLTIKNYNSKLKALKKSFEQLNKVNVTNSVKILQTYYKLKEQEFDFAHKGLIMKEEERELLREERELEKEEKKALQEIEKKKSIVDKDITHYNNMVDELQKQIGLLKDSNAKLELEKEIKKLENMKAEKEKEKESLDFREKNAKAGYVYVISNIGSFGNDIIKIGVTRRLEPLDRIRELSSASVPFRFDVHAMVFSNDAFKLESSLHKKFSEKRVNLVNNRKEFFNITIDEVKDALEEHKNLTINFNEKAEALEYRDSLKLRKQKV